MSFLKGRGMHKACLDVQKAMLHYKRDILFRIKGNNRDKSKTLPNLGKKVSANYVLVGQAEYT